MMNKALTLIVACAAALLLSGLPGTADANPNKLKKPVSAAHAKKMQQRSIKRKERSLERINKRLDGMNAVAKDLKDRGVADLKTTEKARFDTLARQRDKLKQELVSLKRQTVEQYAASRGIELIPAPPTSPPPPLPPGSTTSAGLLTVPLPPAQPAKSFRKPDGTSKITIDRSTNF